MLWALTDIENSAASSVIVSASERISEFCAMNGMSAKETMRLQMSMEEVMTLISKINGDKGASDLRFDLVFHVFSSDCISEIVYSHYYYITNPVKVKKVI